MNRMTDNQLEDTLMEEMKKIMSIEEMDGIEEEVEEYPTEQLEIRLHKYKNCHVNCIQVVLFPMDMELVDQDYRYIVQFVVVQIDGVFHFKNLGIQTFV